MSPLSHKQGHRNRDVGQPLLMNTRPSVSKTPSESMRLYDADSSPQPRNMHIAGVINIGREQLIRDKGFEHAFIGMDGNYMKIEHFPLGTPPPQPLPLHAPQLPVRTNQDVPPNQQSPINTPIVEILRSIQEPHTQWRPGHRHTSQMWSGRTRMI